MMSAAAVLNAAACAKKLMRVYHLNVFVFSYRLSDSSLSLSHDDRNVRGRCPQSPLVDRGRRGSK